MIYETSFTKSSPEKSDGLGLKFSVRKVILKAVFCDHSANDLHDLILFEIKSHQLRVPMKPAN